MSRTVWIGALLTGTFCAAFALGVDVLTDMLDRTNILVVSFISGFLGSLFASLVLRRKH